MAEEDDATNAEPTWKFHNFHLTESKPLPTAEAIDAAYYAKLTQFLARKDPTNWADIANVQKANLENQDMTMAKLNAEMQKAKQSVGLGSEFYLKTTTVATVDTTTSVKPKVVITKRARCLSCKRVFCPNCKICETRDCRYYGYAVATQEILALFPELRAKTQKVRGFAALQIQCYLPVPKPWYVAVNEEELQSIGKQALGSVIGLPGYTPSKKLMVRPAPIRPRHGFVESQTVTSMEGIEKIFKEARKHDPEAELLLMPFMDAMYNAVITPTMLAFGPGHDGGTAGKDSYSIPLSGAPFAELRPGVVRNAGVDLETEDPYLEVIIGSEPGSTYFTQLRAGAKTAGIREDFVPNRMRVKRVLTAGGDLVEWETTIKKGLAAGTVVSHVGGSLISHYAVHCLLANVPIVTSHQPRVGEVLEMTSAITALDPDAVALGCGFGVALPIQKVITTANASLLLLGIAHNALAMTGNMGIWVGIAASCMLRLGMAASHGERRHGRECINGISRDFIYTQAFKDFWKSRQTLGHTAWDFRELAWASGYGGPKWYRCTESALQLEKAIRALLVFRTESHVKDVVRMLHNAINQAHNGGRYLNKFCNKRTFDQAAQQSLYSITGMVPHLDLVRKYFKDFTADSAARNVLTQWAVLDDPAVEENIETSVGRPDGKTKAAQTEAETAKSPF